MGCAVEVVVVGGSPDSLYRARTSIDHLERCWSRFQPSSDISRLNHAAGSTIVVDPATLVLVRAMGDGWRATSGAFDPTLLAPLVGLGYGASWHDPAMVTSLPRGSMPQGNLDEIVVDQQRRTISIPNGMCLDAGGIGKGLAADLVVGELLAAGAAGASVSIGGDVAVRGDAPQRGGWLVGVADPVNPDVEAGQVAMVEGGIATSGTLRRSWTAGDGQTVHHLLDPATGTPVHHALEIVSVTVIAGTAAWAEVWTKAVMVGGISVLQTLDQLGLGAQVTYVDSTTAANRAWAAFDVLGQQRGDLVGDEVEMVEV